MNILYYYNDDLLTTLDKPTYLLLGGYVINGKMQPYSCKKNH